MSNLHTLRAGAAISALLLAASAGTARAQAFTPGDLVVTTYGGLNSTSITDGQITPIILQEFALPTATSASLVASHVLPSTGNGANVGIVGEYASSSEGTLLLSGNGQYLTIGGYDGNAAAQGIQAASNSANGTSFAAGTAWGTSTIALAQSAAVDVPRVAATIDANGNVDTSTVLNDVYNTNNPRGVYSQDGTSFYISGQGASASDEGGLYKVALGTNTTAGGSAPTPIFNVVSTREVQAVNGNLYYSADQNSSKKGTLTGIFEYSGIPTSSQGSSTGTRLTPASLTIGGKTINLSPEGFAFANSTTMYVADTGIPKAGGTGLGGIQKWTLANSIWSLDYTLTDANFLAANVAATAAHGESGFEALTVRLDGSGNVDIYAISYTAGNADPNGLYGIADSLSATTLPGSESFTEIESAPGSSNAGGADYNFKGVAFAPTAAVPEPGTWGMAIGGLGLLIAYTRARQN